MFAQFAPVAPVHILKQLKKAGHLGHYHLILAHDVLQHGEEFRELFDMEDHNNDEIIIDNSVIELGKPIDFLSIMQASEEILQRNLTVVMPDVLMDRIATKKVVADSLATLEFHRDPRRKLGIMFVPQGSTFSSFVQSAEDFMHVGEITHIGVPRNLLQVTDTRVPFIKLMQAMYPHAKLHLLGFSDNLVDDFISVNTPGVRGIDSAVPLRIGSLSMDFNISLPKAIPLRSQQPFWWERGEFNHTVVSNVIKTRRLCGG